MTASRAPNDSAIWTDARSVLRLATAGDVDDGKSTLLGRMLYDTGAVPSDQVAALGATPDFSLLFDGLEAEREQGITIDVAYRYLSTPQRRFIVADAPGHVQYTRNMITAASQADVALVLVDVVKALESGLSEQTRRHLTVAALVGLDVIVAINKLDLVDFSQSAFARVRDAVGDLGRELGVGDMHVMPVAARRGDNVVTRGSRLAWWPEGTLFERLCTIQPRPVPPGLPLRLPVQRIAVHPGRDGVPLRFIAGQIESGALARGDEIAIVPSGETAAVKDLYRLGVAVERALAGDAVTIVLDRAVDVARGDVLAPRWTPTTSCVEATLCWMADRPWTPVRRLLLKQGTRTTPAVIDTIGATMAVKAGEREVLERNEIARTTISTQAPLLADRYRDLPATGSFVLMDPITNETCAAGFIRSAVSLDMELGAGGGI